MFGENSSRLFEENGKVVFTVGLQRHEIMETLGGRRACGYSIDFLWYIICILVFFGYFA